jgi:hypothetical protein
MIVGLHIILIRFYVTNLNNILQEVVKDKLSVNCQVSPEEIWIQRSQTASMSTLKLYI